jgi:hypothetical protein
VCVCVCVLLVLVLNFGVCESSQCGKRKNNKRTVAKFKVSYKGDDFNVRK